MQRAYFLGGASPEGFRTAFWQEQAGRYGIYLKGGPGTGKSTLMKKLAAAFAGEPVEVYHCASDPSSLDAVVLPERGVFVADATAPHESGTPLPCITGELLDLGAGLLPEKLTGDAAEQAQALYRENTARHEQVRRGLAAVSALENAAGKVAAAALDAERLHGFGVRLAAKLFRSGSGTGHVYQRQAAALTPKGRMLLLPAEWERITLLDDHGAAAALLLEQLSRAAAAAGFDCECTRSLTRAGSPIVHLLLPGLQTALLSGMPAAPAEGTVIRLQRFYDAEALRRQRSWLRFTQKTAAALETQITALLAEALAIHDDLEQHYIAALNKAFLDRKTAELITRIRAR